MMGDSGNQENKQTWSHGHRLEERKLLSGAKKARDWNRAERIAVMEIRTMFTVGMVGQGRRLLPQGSVQAQDSRPGLCIIVTGKFYLEKKQ